MRILLLTEFFPQSDAGEITGGVEARCFYVTRFLRERHHVEVLAAPTDGRQWDHASFASLPRRLFFLARAVASGLRKDFDVVEGSNFVVHPIAWLLGAVRRRPVVLYYPDVLVGEWTQRFGAIGLVGELAERAILKLPVAQYLVTTEAVATKLTAAGVKDTKITILPCGFDEDVVARIRQEDPQPSYDVVVVSRLVGYKRVDLVLRALARLAAGMPELRALVIGRGPELEPLRSLASELGLASAVEFRGYVPRHADVLRLMARARVFVSASEVEGFGIVLAEALALGVPFVASDIEVFREVLGNGTGGLLFEPGNVVDLATKLAVLLNDDGLHRSKREEALELSTRYTWRRISRETEDLYERVLARAGGSPRGKGLHG